MGIPPIMSSDFHGFSSVGLLTYNRLRLLYFQYLLFSPNTIGIVIPFEDEKCLCVKKIFKQLTTPKTLQSKATEMAEWCSGKPLHSYLFGTQFEIRGLGWRSG
jgi:hypothetical protein